MVVAVPRPLVDLPPAFGSEGKPPEDIQISRLISANPLHREAAAAWLRRNGDAITASKLERLLTERELPKEARRAAGLVLQDLSWKYMDFAKSPQGHINRMIAISGALSNRNAARARLRS